MTDTIATHPQDTPGILSWTVNITTSEGKPDTLTRHLRMSVDDISQFTPGQLVDRFDEAVASSVGGVYQFRRSHVGMINGFFLGELTGLTTKWISDERDVFISTFRMSDINNATRFSATVLCTDVEDRSNEIQQQILLLILTRLDVINSNKDIRIYDTGTRYVGAKEFVITVRDKFSLLDWLSNLIFNPWKRVMGK